MPIKYIKIKLDALFSKFNKSWLKQGGEIKIYTKTKGVISSINCRMLFSQHSSTKMQKASMLPLYSIPSLKIQLQMLYDSNYHKD